MYTNFLQYFRSIIIGQSNILIVTMKLTSVSEFESIPVDVAGGSIVYVDPSWSIILDHLYDILLGVGFPCSYFTLHVNVIVVPTVVLIGEGTIVTVNLAYSVNRRKMYRKHNIFITG